MKTDIPKNFLDQYQDKRQHLQDTLDQVTALLRLRLSQSEHVNENETLFSNI